MNNVEILDCSLRDGGYRTNWHFSRNRVSSLVRTLGQLGIERLEFGFKFPGRKASMGPFSNVSDLMAQQVTGGDISLGFMLEAKGATEFPDTKGFVQWALQDTKLFKFVRIATTLDDLGVSLEMASELVDEGKEVFINIMRASELSPEDLLNLPKPGWAGISGFYLADSFGSMDAEKTSLLVSSLVAAGHRVGFHAHNNRGMAFANSLAAIAAGATIIDGTLAGHGRGSGNTKTEELAAEIAPYSEALMANLFNLGEHLEQYEYSHGDASGENSFAFHLGAKIGLHPNLVMSIFEANPTLGLGEVLTVIGKSASTFLQDEDPVSLVRNSSSHIPPDTAEPLKFNLRGKKFFLFARGVSLQSDYSDFEHFRKVNGVASGFLNGVPGGMNADLVFALHSFRRGVVARQIEASLSLERVCAFSKPAETEHKGVWTHIPVEIEENGFGLSPDGGPLKIPANTVLAYALGVLGNSGVQEVCLGGFDSSIDAVEEQENRDVLTQFQKAFGSVKLSAVGDNQYGLEQVSLW